MTSTLQNQKSGIGKTTLTPHGADHFMCIGSRIVLVGGVRRRRA
jgi:hypothetical protein